jgi:hypothetical protein
MKNNYEVIKFERIISGEEWFGAKVYVEEFKDYLCFMFRTDEIREENINNKTELNQNVNNAIKNRRRGKRGINEVGAEDFE